MAKSVNHQTQKAALHAPSLEEVAKVVGEGLTADFSRVNVRVVDCPDLTAEPFMLSAKGICGNPRLADIGGPPYLLPIAQQDKVYNMDEIAQLVELPDAFLIGAGAGPRAVIGVNSEMICNLKLNCENGLNTYIAKVDTQTNDCILEKVTSKEFMLMANLLCSNGNPGKVLEVRASQRIGPRNFMTSIRKVLENYYGTKPVGLGGVFLIEKGKAKLHVMPDFSEVPLQTDEEVNSWLKFYEVDAPLVCLGELVSCDPGLNLRIEHFHCFSDHGQGGHYHYDTTPSEVEYRGYFSIAEFIYRIDRPAQANQMMRD